jgi:hypothetical protein
MDGYSPGTYDLLWPPAFAQVAEKEGWVLRRIGGTAEVDYHPVPDNADGSPYRMLMQWIVLNAYVFGSTVHRIAWEFEHAANADIYADGRVPGDGMHGVVDVETGEHKWVDDDDNDGWASAWRQR